MVSGSRPHILQFLGKFLTCSPHGEKLSFGIATSPSCYQRILKVQADIAVRKSLSAPDFLHIRFNVRRYGIEMGAEHNSRQTSAILLTVTAFPSEKKILRPVPDFKTSTYTLPVQVRKIVFQKF